MGTSIVAAHPAETWAIIGALAAAILGLVGLLYGRMNKDLAEMSERVDCIEEEFIKLRTEHKLCFAQFIKEMQYDKHGRG